jgi:hypothetical protein
MAKLEKKYPKHVTEAPKKLVPAVVVFFLLALFMQNRQDPVLKEIRQAEGNFIAGTSNLTGEFLLLPLLGFREAAAGLLWVRCDEFFHSGDYDAILPLVRLITWLDPHADNVFITGAWHLAYNFTDSTERSDRRYIIPAHELLKEGIKNNPRIPDIGFEMGWQNYDKTKDYATAATYFKKIIDIKPWKGSEDFPYGAPLKTHHILAHTYARMGRIPDAIAEWELALKRSEAERAKDPKSFTARSMNDAETRNIAMLKQRFRDRYTTSGHSKEVNPTSYPAVLIPPGGKGEPRPWDVNLRSSISVDRSKVLKIKGTFNIADGARVDVRLTDWDYDQKDEIRRNAAARQLLERFVVPSDATILQDTVSVRKNRFERELDMSKDPKMYPFVSSTRTYRLTLSFNPRSTSPHVQDRHGYSGEGLIDRPEVVEYDRRPELLGTTLIKGQGGEGEVWDGITIPWNKYGQPVRGVRITYKLSQEQILGLKPITEKDIVENGLK